MYKLCGCGTVIKLGDKRCRKCEGKRAGNGDRKEYHRWYDKKRRDKTNKYFYQSKEWKRLREVILARDNYLCVECMEQGRLTDAYAVDHIVPLSDNWFLRLSASNLQSLCQSCHSRKTRSEYVHKYVHSPHVCR